MADSQSGLCLQNCMGGRYLKWHEGMVQGNRITGSAVSVVPQYPSGAATEGL